MTICLLQHPSAGKEWWGPIATNPVSFWLPNGHGGGGDPLAGIPLPGIVKVKVG